MKIVALSGKARSGKTLVANELASHFGWNHISLAGPLKAEVRARFGLTKDQTDGMFKEQPTQYRRRGGGFYTPRDIMIRWGFASREIDSDYWLKQIVFDEETVNVISDLRFRNEAEFFRSRGAQLVRLERDSKYRGPDINDASETELDNYAFDLIIPTSLNQTAKDIPSICSTIHCLVNYSPAFRSK